MKHVVIVESPAKAETINKYLGSDYKVLASYGHIRDLPAKNGSVDPEDNFAMQWQVDDRANKRVQEITKEVKSADSLILATDPDREGEAISWHVYEVLKDKKAIGDKKVTRVVFNEITKSAILKAMENPREIDSALVDAYMARRALDYLVGFNLSPILWRKLPGSRSAGRVQSVALRMICERENDIEIFNPEEYWSVTANLKTKEGTDFQANVFEWEGDKLDKMSLNSETKAQAVTKLVEAEDLSVTSMDTRRVRRNPQPPFITSTLQQDASRKLGFSVSKTMQVAQKLYEGISLEGETTGLITYMRTDGVNLSEEAVASIRGYIGLNFGDKYLPEAPRVYKSKAKNAQEAHEAIRPTDVARTPEFVQTYLNEDQFKLYQLIWKRAMACQMQSAELDQVTVLIHPQSKSIGLKATGSMLVFDGFLKVYQVASKDDDDKMLPTMEQGDDLHRESVLPEQHFTKPPPRFTEASLVKSMEELGIGRPSTYASIIRVLQDRNYVRLESKRFIPEDRGRLVTTFLTNFFQQYVEYDFTANLEGQLDKISANELGSSTVLSEFWKGFTGAIGNTKDLTITEVIDTLDDALGHHFFPPGEDGKDTRNCPTCDDGRLGLRLGRYGAFIGCSNYPECKYTRQFKVAGEEDDGDELFAQGPVELGNHPDNEKMITMHKGPYGVYLQLGEAEEVPPAPGSRAKKPKIVKPKRASLPADLPPGQVTMDRAVSLLSLPREVGVYPETGDMITAGLGRFGPFLKFDDMFVSLKDHDVLTVTLEEATEVIKKSGKRSIHVGEYKKKPVKIQKGRFGFFIVYGKLKVALPKDSDPDAVTLDDAIERIEAKKEKEAAAKGKTTKGKTTKAKPKAKTKTATKKSTKAVAKKKTATKKTTAKKTAKKSS